LEGPAWKISRRQGVIKLKTSGEFFIDNEGKRNIFVDGRPVICVKFDFYPMHTITMDIIHKQYCNVKTFITHVGMLCLSN
jgi:hypothetical protein